MNNGAKGGLSRRAACTLGSKACAAQCVMLLHRCLLARLLLFEGNIRRAGAHRATPAQVHVRAR